VRPPTRLALAAAFASVYLFWGATFLAIRYAVADIPPLLTIGLRCAGGAAILYAWVAVRGPAERTTAAQWATAGAAAVLLFLGCHGLLAWAEQRVSSGQAALFMTAIPLFMVLLETLRTRRRPANHVLAGLALGTLGVAVLTGGAGDRSGTLLDRIALIVSAFGWAAGSLVARHGARPASVARGTAMQLAAGAAVVLAASAVAGELAGWHPGQVTVRAAAALGFLIVCGTVLGFGAYTWLLQTTTAAAATTYAFVNPVVALALAWLVGDEVLTSRSLVAALFVVGAVVLIRERPARRPAGRGWWAWIGALNKPRSREILSGRTPVHGGRR